MNGLLKCVKTWGRFGSSICFQRGHLFNLCLCRILQYYEFVTFDHENVQRIMLQQAALYKEIRNSERFYLPYYRVAFYGSGFDDTISGQAFVYRGSPLEPIMDFSNRIKLKFPTAKMRMSSEIPSDDVQFFLPVCLFFVIVHSIRCCLILPFVL